MMEGAEQTSPAAIVEEAALIIFGLDDQKKPHASAFALSEVDPAQKAASLMGMATFVPRNEEEQALAAQLPRGRIFGSGRAFVPFVAAGVYKRLCELAGVKAIEPAAAPESERPGSPSPDNVVAAPPAPAGEPSSANAVELTIGAVVLACENRDSGFYEAVVTGINGELLTLRWENWPKYPVFTRRQWQVAPLPERKPYW